MTKPKFVTLSGNVYCDWTAFSLSGIAPMPTQLEDGDIVVWSWSGKRREPSSNPFTGLLRVSVVHRGKRHFLKQRRSPIHAWLKFSSDRNREENLRKVVNELRTLRGRLAQKSKFGWWVQPQEQAPAVDDTAAQMIAGRPSRRVKPGIDRELPKVVAAPGVAPQKVVPPPAAIEQAMSPPAPRVAPTYVKPPKRKQRARVVDDRQLPLL
jgi:hypothetical protein